jgi:hypothetical protein
MKNTLKIAVGMAIVLGAGICARADLYTVPLSLSEVTGANGQYLSADFDFHTQFSSIDAVTVSFAMPAGYEGTAIASGYSSIFSQMWVVITGGSNAPVFGYIIGPPFSNPQLSTAQFMIPAGVAQQDAWLYGDLVDDPGDIALESPQPDFLFAGKGSVAWSDVVSKSYGFGPLDGPSTFTITWQVPDEIIDASITISGTAVPEPSGVVLLAIAAVIAWCGVPRRCCRRGPTTSS